MPCYGSSESTSARQIGEINLTITVLTGNLRLLHGQGCLVPVLFRCSFVEEQHGGIFVAKLFASASKTALPPAQAHRLNTAGAIQPSHH